MTIVLFLAILSRNNYGRIFCREYTSACNCGFFNETHMYKQRVSARRKNKFCTMRYCACEQRFLYLSDRIAPKELSRYNILHCALAILTDSSRYRASLTPITRNRAGQSRRESCSRNFKFTFSIQVKYRYRYFYVKHASSFVPRSRFEITEV